MSWSYNLIKKSCWYEGYWKDDKVDGIGRLINITWDVSEG